MDLNADFTKRVVIHSNDVPWQASPMPGVDRRMLDRIGDEVARATTIVRYAPESHFSAHTHTGGEEFIVLEGVFQDEHGDFPAGSYVRNPPTTSHTPGSAPGCTIFVKLWQFDMDDRKSVRIDMNAVPLEDDPARVGVRISALFDDARESVQLEQWVPAAHAPLVAEGGAEILVLEGQISEGGDTLGPHDWLRLPEGTKTAVTAGPDGARIWVKSGHLSYAAAPRVAPE